MRGAAGAGWTDPETGREYALIGRIDAAAFVDVTNPEKPIYVGELPRTEGTQASSWREIKTYKNWALIVSDGSGQHGVQFFDLTRLRNVKNAPVKFTADHTYRNVASVHNIVVNEDAGLAASVAKAYVSEAARKACGEAIQVHGGIGFTWEYDLHLYFKRAKALEATWGDADYHRELVVRHVAG